MNSLLFDTARRKALAHRFGWAWLALAASLALHVTDEALHDFLGVYNPLVNAIRARVPWLPLPTFTFWPWISGLAAGIVALLALAPLARRGRTWIIVVGTVLSALMVGNGLGHIGSSLYLHRLVPGVYSSPLLVLASAATLTYAVRLWWARTAKP